MNVLLMLISVHKTVTIQITPIIVLVTMATD